MYAVEFQAPIKNGVVNIPKEYKELQNHDNNVKFIVMVDEISIKSKTKKKLNAISLDTSDFKFDREKSNER